MPGKISRLKVSNFKSIESIALELDNITFLVGLNGSGKSNIVDSLAFLADCLINSIDYAIRVRGGTYSVFRQASKTTRILTIGIDFENDGSYLNYTFSIKLGKFGYTVHKESLKKDSKFIFKVDSGRLIDFVGNVPPRFLKDRLFLQTASGLEDYRPYFDLLSSIKVYSPNPESMRQLYTPDISEILRRDASNIASVTNFHSLDKNRLGYNKIVDFMKKVNYQFYGFSRRRIDRFEGLYMTFSTSGGLRAFSAYNASDGTLRALGILSALFFTPQNQTKPLLIGIEEPETSLHPAAAAVLLDAIRVAATDKQVIATTHSPDLLEHADITSEKIIYVESNKYGFTSAREINDQTKQIVAEGLYNPGELLRMEQLG